jgi:limonene-1,2-epoxide hydrolase
MASDPDAVVRAFIAEFDAEHPSIDRLLAYFTDDAVYHNMPGPPSVGRQAVRNGLAYTERITSAGWTIVHQLASGDVVVNERIDRFKVGDRIVELPVCGVFEVRDGKIAAWRDYFDMATFQRLMSPPAEA